MATLTPSFSQRIILRGIPYRVYARMTRLWGNRHLRMTYRDGTLEIVSPHLMQQEELSGELRLIITTVADRLGLRYHGTGSCTFRRAGEGPRGGHGKEPDQSFYFANVDRLPRDRDPSLDAGDPPPDLWIEVDHRASSKGRLPVYAALGVPEVWRYRADRRSLQFLELTGETYRPIDASLALPSLTPALVLEALKLGENLIESDWIRAVREWADRTFPRE